MAGKLQFDRDKALADAVQIFWAKGFTRTSMEDIKQATGIKESSLYNTFGNKESLFMEALEIYRNRILAELESAPNLEYPKKTLTGLLRRIGKQASGQEGAAGCMIMNSAMELGAENPPLAAFAQKFYTDFENWVHETVVQGQELGEISNAQPPRALARFITYNVQSLFTIGRTAPSKEFMNDVVETMVSVL
jgi:TetR/AcrR family transcriptional repressor of nem operon